MANEYWSWFAKIKTNKLSIKYLPSLRLTIQLIMGISEIVFRLGINFQIYIIIIYKDIKNYRWE